MANVGNIGDYPSNSKNKKPANFKQDKALVKPVVTGKVTRKKQPLSKKFKESFFSDEGGKIGTYILNDVLIPGAKQIIYDIAMNSLGLSLFGQTMSHSTKRHGGTNGITNYRSASANNSRNGNRRTVNQTTRATHSFDDILIDDKFEADSVLIALQDLVDEYGHCTVSDLYDLVSITPTHADKRYGWTNLTGAYIKREIGGYLIILPRTEVI